MKSDQKKKKKKRQRTVLVQDENNIEVKEEEEMGGNNMKYDQEDEMEMVDYKNGEHGWGKNIGQVLLLRLI